MAVNSSSGVTYPDNLKDYMAATNPNPTSIYKGDATLDKNTFLTILMAQLQHQDPTNPMDNTQMVAQLAQFSQLEQLQQLTSNYEQSLAYGMIGKFVCAQMRDASGNLQNGYIYGFVDSVFSNNGEMYVNVGGSKLKLSDVKEVYDKDAIAGNPGELGNASGLIGKYVTATSTKIDETGVEVEIEVNGFADRVIVDEGMIYLIIKDEMHGEHAVLYSSISEVRNDKPTEEEELNALVGKYIIGTAEVDDGNGGKQTVDVKGTAKKIESIDDIDYLVVEDPDHGEVYVARENIKDVYNKAPDTGEENSEQSGG
ncbi:hypothetical protein LJC32_01530 [Oscillospiraceae bacterium OttesenSCG-928-F05]|nr:hypothetical protein [Oscillospiraceae bacterium OttesenSCG-928-F05]